MVRLKAYDSCALKKIGLQAALGPLVLSVQKPVLETGLIDSIRTWTKWKDEASTPWPHNIIFLSSGNRPPAPATSNRHRAPAPGIRHPASGTGIRHRPPAPGIRHTGTRHPEIKLIYSSHRNTRQPNPFLQPNVVTNNIWLPQEDTVKSSKQILNLDLLGFLASYLALPLALFVISNQAKTYNSET